MKGIKRRFVDIRRLALGISIFMVIGLFSNITVKADELENVEVNPVVSEEAEIEDNQQCNTENELLIPEETTEYENAPSDEIADNEVIQNGNEENDVTKEEVSTAEETDKQDKVIEEEPVNNEVVNGEEGTTEEDEKQPQEDEVKEEAKEKMELSLLVNGASVTSGEEVKLNEDDEIYLNLNYNTKDEAKAGDTLVVKIPSFIKVEKLNYSTEDFLAEHVADEGTVTLTFKEKLLNVGEGYLGGIEIIGTIEHTDETSTQAIEVLLKESVAYTVGITAIPKASTDPNPQDPVEEVFKGSVELTKVEKENHDKVLPGAMFMLFNEKSEKIGDIYTTDEQGKIVVNDLVEGNYYFVEIVPPTGYVMDDLSPVKFTISKDNKEIVSVIKENTLLPKVTFPTINNNSGSTTNKLSGLSKVSKLTANTSTKYGKTLPNTGGNSKAVILVIALVAILVGAKFIRRNKDNNIT